MLNLTLVSWVCWCPEYVGVLNMFIWLGTSQQLQKVDSNRIQLGSDVVKLQTTVNNLGVTIDNHLSTKEHVQRICRSSFYQLRQIRTVRTSLTRVACESLVHAFVSNRLDYCNSMLFGINESLLDKLESVLCAAARPVQQKKKFDLISTDIRNKLHWLLIRQRIARSKAVSLFTDAYRVQRPTISPRCWRLWVSDCWCSGSPETPISCTGNSCSTDDCGSTLRASKLQVSRSKTLDLLPSFKL